MFLKYFLKIFFYNLDQYDVFSSNYIRILVPGKLDRYFNRNIIPIIFWFEKYIFVYIKFCFLKIYIFLKTKTFNKKKSITNKNIKKCPKHLRF